MKPITKALVYEAMDTVFEYKKEQRLKIEIITGNIHKYFYPEEIYYFQHMDRKTYVFSKKGAFETYKSLAEFEKEIGDWGFLSVNRAYLVNLENVEFIENNCVFMQDGRKITLSCRKISVFKNKYRIYLESQLPL